MKEKIKQIKSPVIAVAIIMVASFMDLLDATIISVASPAIGQDLGASSAGLQWMLAAYTLALGAGLVTGGRIGDEFGRRKVFIGGLIGFTLASFACAISPSESTLIASRVLQGLAGGFMIPQVFGIIRSSLTQNQSAKAYAVYGGVLSLASVAGPLLGGLLVDANLFSVGWRMIFLINIPIGIVAVILGLKFIPESQSQSKIKLDIIGASLISLTSLLILLPLTQGTEWGWPWWSFCILFASLPLIAIFLRYEKSLIAKGGQPILNPQLLHIRTFTAGLASSLLFFGAIGSFFFLLSLYLQLGTGRSALSTGLIILPYAIGSVITSGIGIQLVRKYGNKVLISGSLILAISLFILQITIHADSGNDYWLFALPLFIGGLGLGLTAPSLINVILSGVPRHEAGSASGVLSTITQIGSAAGVAILGLLFFSVLNNSFAHNDSTSSSYTNAFNAILPWQIAIYIIAACLMALLPSKMSIEPETEESK